MAAEFMWDHSREKSASSSGWLQPEDELWTWPAPVTDTEVGHEDWFLVPGTLPGSNPIAHCFVYPFHIARQPWRACPDVPSVDMVQVAELV